MENVVPRCISSKTDGSHTADMTRTEDAFYYHVGRNHAVIKVVLHAAIFRAASLATPLRDMLHESLQRVTPRLATRTELVYNQIFPFARLHLPLSPLIFEIEKRFFTCNTAL